MSEPAVEQSQSDQCAAPDSPLSSFSIDENYFTPEEDENESETNPNQEPQTQSQATTHYHDTEIEKLNSNMMNFIKVFFETPAYLDGEDYEIEIAELEKNQNKNRYIDIMPYDKTRVILKGENDYINANYIQMENEKGINRKWIAAQGPLPNTVHDFYQMIWQSETELIIMVTQVVERGRRKCDQYWDSDEKTFGDLKVKMIAEDVSLRKNGIIERTLSLSNGDQTREVTQIQFVDWPDHGVPDDPSHFLEFLLRINKLKNELDLGKPTIVHCSAGVGRTGVTISLDYALENIRHNLENHPIQILIKMRQQRPCLVQTPDQFRFICSTIILLHENHE